jgi:pterin-4a-carbinolamine dehydratase
MTLQRIQDRGAHLSNNWKLLTSVTGIQFHYRFATFQEAAGFVDREVGRIAEASGYSPVVEIDGNDVVLTLGVETPQILSEGDFDFAEAVDGVFPEPEPPAAKA